MESGNIGHLGPNNFGGVVHELKANHNKETDGPFGQAVSALAKTKHGPLPPPPVDSTSPVSGDDSVDIQASPLQTTTVAVLNAVNETFGSNLTLSSQPAEQQPVEVGEIAVAAEEDPVEAEEAEVLAEQTEPVTSVDESSVADAAQEIVSLTTALFDAETDQIDNFYDDLVTAIETGFKDGLASYSNADDVNQVLAAYEQVQQGINDFYQEKTGTESGRVWQDLTLTAEVEQTEGVPEITSAPDGDSEELVEGQPEEASEPVPEYAQIQSLLDDTSSQSISIEA